MNHYLFRMRWSSENFAGLPIVLQWEFRWYPCTRPMYPVVLPLYHRPWMCHFRQGFFTFPCASNGLHHTTVWFFAQPNAKCDVAHLGYCYIVINATKSNWHNSQTHSTQCNSTQAQNSTHLVTTQHNSMQLSQLNTMCTVYNMSKSASVPRHPCLYCVFVFAYLHICCCICVCIWIYLPFFICAHRILVVSEEWVSV